MRSSFAIILLLVGLVASAQVKDLSAAKVEQVSGFYIFWKSNPVSEKQFLGTVNVGVTWSAKPGEAFNHLTKKARKEFPTANGLIIREDFKKADVYKLK